MNGLYIHIPYCNQICYYCDFVKKIGKYEEKRNYVDAVQKELLHYKHNLQLIDTIYIGGGTPSSLPMDLLTKLLEDIQSIVPMESILEYTIECNPNDVTNELIDLFKNHHVNRISLGAQSFQNHLLSLINRNHTTDDIINAIRICKNKGLHNINVDMIYGLPSQTMQDLEKDIKHLIDFNIDHISLYSLILEEKTVFHKMVREQNLTLPDDDLVSDMYEFIVSRLKTYDYDHYEISNFCRNNQVSRHNLKYWSNVPYIGIGAGASGYLNRIRYDNPKTITQYLKYVESFDQQFLEESYIDDEELLKEYFILGLRKKEGINMLEIKELLHIDVMHEYDFSKYIKLGYMRQIGNRICFTEKGFLVSNSILVELI